MRLAEFKPREMVRWLYKDNASLLCRVRFVGHEFVSLQVLAATEEQVLASGLAAGEMVNTLPQSCRPVDWKPVNA